MIEGLRGTLRARREGEIVVDVNGLRLRVSVSNATLAAMPDVGKPVEVLTRFVVKEDAMELYGFSSEPEREAFGLITEAKGIGPKLAMKVLSGMSVREFQLAVLKGDVARLSAVRGVGKARAEQLVFALRKKIQGAVPEGESPAATPKLSDATKTLVALGYPEGDAARAVGAAAEKSGALASVQDIVIAALRILSE